MYYRNRMFDTGLGRFIGRDPIGYVDGTSLYDGYFVPNGLDPAGLFRAMCYDKTKCPDGCEEKEVAYYHDERTIAERKREGAVGEPGKPLTVREYNSLSETEQTLRNLKQFSSKVTPVDTYGGMEKSATDECPECQCLKLIYIQGHGSNEGLVRMGPEEPENTPRNQRRGFYIAPTGHKLLNSGATSWTAVGQMLNPLVCKKCEIYLFACRVGENNAAAKELAKFSGCTVYSYCGRWGPAVGAGDASGTWVPSPSKGGQEMKTTPDGVSVDTGTAQPGGPVAPQTGNPSWTGGIRPSDVRKR
jgi:hypothetical protein